jgi:ribonucleoside-triphosphate reductase
MDKIDVKVIKKDGTLEDFDFQKIINACSKSASRALDNLTNDDYRLICDNTWEYIEDEVLDDGTISVETLHAIVERTLLDLYPKSGECYRQYRNYKKDFVHMMDDVYNKSQSIRYIGDKSNANTDATMTSTQRSLIYGELNKNLYDKFFLNADERQAARDGYIYIHDKKDRLDSVNCCLFNMGYVLKNGFEI